MNPPAATVTSMIVIAIRQRPANSVPASIIAPSATRPPRERLRKIPARQSGTATRRDEPHQRDAPAPEREAGAQREADEQDGREFVGVADRARSRERFLRRSPDWAACTDREGGGDHRAEDDRPEHERQVAPRAHRGVGDRDQQQVRRVALQRSGAGARAAAPTAARCVAQPKKAISVHVR